MEQNNFAKGMNICYTKKESGDDEEDVVLPGFRFHPTDEELIGFYLRRKVENRVLSIELIKEVDIYKYNPWDLPKASNVGENECYFFCRRARKYRNSIRPNRVTDSGFWKATGIDKPIYSSDQKIIIGLKKSLVFYRGSAGKGTKTEWMLHEFRIPTSHFISKSIKQVSQEEAEIWTLCRILKRSKPHKRGITDWKEISLTKTIPANTSSKTWTHDPSPNPNQNYEVGYINFQHTLGNNKQVVNYRVKNSNEMLVSELSSRNQVSSNSPIMIECSMYDEWDELWPLVDLTTEPFHALKDITKI